MGRGHVHLRSGVPYLEYRALQLMGPGLGLVCSLHNNIIFFPFSIAIIVVLGTYSPHLHLSPSDNQWQYMHAYAGA